MDIHYGNLVLLTKSIFKNKNRSLSLVSGIILGTMILSGIVLYTAILRDNNYKSIVGNASYEIKFDIFNGENLESLNDLKENLSEDPRVKNSQIFAGKESNKEKTQLLISFISPYSQSDEYIEKSPLFVTEQFNEGYLYEKIVNDNFEGDFDLTDNNTVIPKSIALASRLKVGDIIPLMNVSHTFFSNPRQIETGVLKNLRVSGIYDLGLLDDLASNFQRSNMLSRESLIFDIRHIESNGTLNNIGSLMKKSGNYQLAVKLDENEFSVSDPDIMVLEIDAFINEVTRAHGDDVIGYNLVSRMLFGFQILSIFLSILYSLISIPVILLSLYVLQFGLELSLEDRKRDIAIKKVQGADRKQIFREIRNEIVLLSFIGLVVGYLLATVSAWIISSSVGFMRISGLEINTYFSYVTLDLGAILTPFIILGSVVMFTVYRNAVDFIDNEVSEAVQKVQQNKLGFLKKNNIDYFFFIAGLIGVFISISNDGQMPWKLNLNIWAELYVWFSPFFLWIGGAMVGSRIARYLPVKFDFIFISIKGFRDVSKIIRSGMKRQGDVDKLAIIIILTLSIASLSAIQGVTDETQDIRTLNWEIGADIQASFQDLSNISGLAEIISGIPPNLIDQLMQTFNVSINDFLNNSNNIGNQIQKIDGVEGVQSMLVNQVRILSSFLQIVGIDPELELAHIQNNRSILLWQQDSFKNIDEEEAITRLVDNPMGIFVDEDTQTILDVTVGDKVNLNVNLVTVTEERSQVSIPDIEILGIIRQVPGGYNSRTVLSSQKLLGKLFSLSYDINSTVFENITLPANSYLIKTNNGIDISDTILDQILSDLNDIEGIQSIKSLKNEMEIIRNSSGGFGITGLLTNNFIVSLLASWISAFSFSTIIMQKRRREFAILRAIGARKSQIYKLALGENLLMYIITSVFGSFLGILLSYGYNGIFTNISGELLNPTPLARIVIIPWLDLFIIGMITLFGMFAASMVSVSNAARMKDLTLATRIE